MGTNLLSAMAAVTLSAVVAQASTVTFTVHKDWSADGSVRDYSATGQFLITENTSLGDNFGLSGYFISMGPGATADGSIAPEQVVQKGTTATLKTIGFGSSADTPVALSHAQNIAQQGASAMLYGIGQGTVDWPAISAIDTAFAWTNAHYLGLTAPNTPSAVASPVDIGGDTYSGAFTLANLIAASSSADVFTTGPGSTDHAAATVNFVFDGGSTPEPTSLSLLGLGVIGMLVRRRKYV